MKPGYFALALAGCALVACQSTGPATPPPSAAAAVALPGAAPELGTQTVLTGEQLTSTLSGKQVRVDTVSGVQTNVHFLADGTTTGTIEGGDSDTGTWAVKDGRACNTWKIWRGGAERCFRYVSLGGNRFAGYGDDGALELVLTVPS